MGKATFLSFTLFFHPEGALPSEQFSTARTGLLALHHASHLRASRRVRNGRASAPPSSLRAASCGTSRGTGST